jgi:hypothetical protein
MPRKMYYNFRFYLVGVLFFIANLATWCTCALLQQPTKSFSSYKPTRITNISFSVFLFLSPARFFKKLFIKRFSLRTSHLEILSWKNSNNFPLNCLVYTDKKIKTNRHERLWMGVRPEYICSVKTPNHKSG